MKIRSAPSPAPPAPAADVDGSLAGLLNLDPGALRATLFERVDNVKQLDALEAAESAGRKRVPVFVAIEARRMSLAKLDHKGSKVLPLPVTLDKDGNVVAHEGVDILGEPRAELEEGEAAADLVHRGRFTCYLSLANGQPIYDLSQMGNYGRALLAQAIKSRKG